MRLLEHEAERSKTSVSEVTRRALAVYFGGNKAEKTRKLPFVALGRSGHTHTARDIDKILEREWNDPRHR